MIYKEKINELLGLRTIKTSDGLEVCFFNKGKSNIHEIDLLNERLNLKLPNDYVEFLLNFNGLELYKFEDLDGFLFFDTHSLVKENHLIKGDYDSDDWDASIIIFCRIIGEGNHLGFKIMDKNQYQILDCFHESLPIDWKVIGTSFYFFLNKLIDNVGEKFWLMP